MKFSLATVAAFASVALAAPAASNTDAEVSSALEAAFAIPTEAIIGQFSFDSDEFPIVTWDENHPYVVVLNSTIMDAAYKDLESGNVKRDAEAKWGWIKYWPGQPFVKRDAEAEADAKWGWIKYWPGQPFVKRDAEAKWGWIKYWPGQPFVKRDADADAKWGWIKYWPGQPFVKKDVGSDDA